MKRNVLAILCLVTLVLGGCNGTEDDNNDGGNQSAHVTNNGAPAPQYNLTIFAAGHSQPIYGDGVNNPSQLVQGESYSVNLAQTNGGTYTFKTTFTNVDVPGGSTVVTFANGANGFPNLIPGHYSVKIEPIDSAGNVYPARLYSLRVLCPNPLPMNAAGVDMSALGVSSQGDNLVSFDTAAAVAGVGGVPPYQCVLDANGDGINNSGTITGLKSSIQFPCADGIDNQYVNYTGKRLIQLIVIDSCQTQVIASGEKTIATPSRTPGDGSVFITGTVTRAAGAIANSLALIYNTTPLQNVTYWATNQPSVAAPQSRNPVQPNFNFDNNNSSFTMNTAFSYGLTGSGSFGLSLTMSGIHASIDTSDQNNPQATADASAAYLSSISYNTDSLPPVASQRVQGGTSNCQLSNQQVQIMNVTGHPCAGDTTNSLNNTAVQMTVHGWGTYSCTNLTGSTGNADINGSFDGLYQLTVGCSGGGQGGGGQPPITL